MIRITIDGFAQPQRAPQGAIVPPLPAALRRRHHVVMHTPAEVRKWQVWAKKAAADQMTGKAPFVGMLAVGVWVFLPIPKSMPKKHVGLALAGMIMPITRPDVDNYSKSILDALTGVCWLDDAQIVNLHVRKFYGEKPRVEIEVHELPFPVITKETRPLTETLFKDEDDAK